MDGHFSIPEAHGREDYVIIERDEEQTWVFTNVSITNQKHGSLC